MTWQFIQKTDDPRLSMMRRFAKAMEMPLEELLAESKKSRTKCPAHAMTRLNMDWRFCCGLALFLIMFFLHFNHLYHAAPHHYDDPEFVSKLIAVSLAILTAVVGHLIHHEEDKLK